MTSMRAKARRLSQALIDPALVYSSAKAVADDDALSIADKISVLRRWEYDAHEMQVAEEEGMISEVGANDDLLDAVIDALHSIGSGPGLERSPPTKQGGV